MKGKLLTALFSLPKVFSPIYGSTTLINLCMGIVKSLLYTSVYGASPVEVCGQHLYEDRIWSRT